MVLNKNYINVPNPNISPKLKPDIAYGFRIPVATIEKSDKQKPNSPLADVSLHDMFFPHVTVRTMKGVFGYNAMFTNECNEGSDLIASCLILQGNITSTLKGSDKGILFASGSQSLKYDPFNEYGHYCPEHTPFNIIHLSIEPAYLFSLLPENEAWSDYIKNQIALRRRIFGEVPPGISIAQHHALQNLLHCPLEGKLGLLMQEASLTQILLLQLGAQFKNVNSGNVDTAVRKKDMDIVQSVKDYLTVHFLEEHSLAELGLQFGTNTNKLMLLFRKVFHKSIFEYIHDLKMDHAKKLLIEDGKYVCEAASVVGYKNPQHFSAAFKKKHGISPSQLKCSRNSGIP